MKSIFRLIGILSGAVLATGVAHASVVTFIGGDPGATASTPRPVSNSTAAAFAIAASALGTINVIDFESVQVGSFTTLLIAPGVTLTGLNNVGGPQTIRNTPLPFPENLVGYNTTSGGSHFAQFTAGFMTFTFATPISAFGAFFTGVELPGETITFSDGTTQTIGLLNLGLGVGGVEFVGFTDAGRLISSITINVSPATDGIAIDDVRFVSPRVTTVVPEPSVALLVGLGALALTISRKRKQ